MKSFRLSVFASFVPQPLQLQLAISRLDYWALPSSVAFIPKLDTSLCLKTSTPGLVRGPILYLDTNHVKLCLRDL